jgi:hypothetical protein
MDFARNIRKNVPLIQKSSITRRVPPAILKSANNVPGTEDHGLEAVKLGENGFNEVFLVSLVSLLRSWKSSLALNSGCNPIVRRKNMYNPLLVAMIVRG